MVQVSAVPFHRPNSCPGQGDGETWSNSAQERRSARAGAWSLEPGQLLPERPPGVSTRCFLPRTLRT